MVKNSRAKALGRETPLIETTLICQLSVYWLLIIN